MARGNTRDSILGAAQRLIHERGFAATGMSDILEASGAGSSSVYHHYRGKEQLLATVLDDLKARYREEILDPARTASDDPVERVFAILAFYRSFLTASGCTLGCPVGNLAGEIADTHPKLRARLEDLFTTWRDGVADCLRPVAARLPRGLTPDDLAIFVLAVMEGAVMQARVKKDIAPFDRAVAVLRDHFDRLLGPPQKEPS